MLVQTGLIGVGITTWIFILKPFLIIFTSQIEKPYSRFLLGSILIFIILVNLLESSLLDRANPVWVLTLIIYVQIHDSVSVKR